MILSLYVINFMFQKYLINWNITGLYELRLVSHFKMDSIIKLINICLIIYRDMDFLIYVCCESWKCPSAHHKNISSKLKIASLSELMLIQFFSYYKCLPRFKQLTLLVKYLKYFIEHIPAIIQHASFINQPRNR